MGEFTERLAQIHQCVNGDGQRNLRNILKTCREMLQDRGFPNVTEFALEDENNTLGLVMEGCDCNDGDEKIHVHICTEDRVGVKFARSVSEDAQSTRCIVISIDGPTPFTRKECNSIQFFTAIELCMNVTRHCLVPLHTKIQASELPNGMSVDTLPRILESDRIVQYYNWPCGTVVKIKRVFGGYEPINYFRVVVAVGMV